MRKKSSIINELTKLLTAINDENPNPIWLDNMKAALANIQEYGKERQFRCLENMISGIKAYRTQEGIHGVMMTLVGSLVPMVEDDYRVGVSPTHQTGGGHRVVRGINSLGG
jgi:hypothetical protein